MRPLALSPDLRRRIEVHVRGLAGEEACGILLGREGEEGPRRVVEARAARNGAADRRRCYVVEPADLVAAVHDARAGGLDLLGYYHSHPAGRAEPSSADRASAWPDVSYLILAPDGRDGLETRSWRLTEAGFAEEPIRWG